MCILKIIKLKLLFKNYLNKYYHCNDCKIIEKIKFGAIHNNIMLKM